MSHTVSPASMRPRQSSLGISPSFAETSDRSCCCFNEAEAIKPRNRAELAHGRRHRGRGFNEAEAIKPRNPDVPIRGHVRMGHASMRPRQSSLGIAPGRSTWTRRRRRFNEAEAIKPRNHAPGAVRYVATIPASMRPRQSSLGITTSTR